MLAASKSAVHCVYLNVLLNLRMYTPLTLHAVLNNRFEGRETQAPKEDDATAAMAKSMESLVLAASSITATTSTTAVVNATATTSGSTNGRDIMPPPPPKLRNNTRGVPPPSPRTAEHNEYLSVSSDLPPL
jgi:hypothetical protein